MPAITPYDPLVTNLELRSGLTTIENFPVEVADTNIFLFDDVTQKRLQTIVDYWTELESSSETEHRQWELSDNSFITVTITTSVSYLSELKELKALRSTKAMGEYRAFIVAGGATQTQYAAWLSSYE